MRPDSGVARRRRYDMGHRKVSGNFGYRGRVAKGRRLLGPDDGAIRLDDSVVVSVVVAAGPLASCRAGPFGQAGSRCEPPTRASTP
jgi:hypothetical protein